MISLQCVNYFEVFQEGGVRVGKPDQAEGGCLVAY